MEKFIRNTFFAVDYKTALLDMRIGKRPKLMDKKFEGQDVYTVMGSIASKAVNNQEVDN